MKITIIAVGKKHDASIKPALDEYTTRLERSNGIQWDFLPPSGKPELEARKDESTQIMNKLNPNDVIWLLDERGQQIESTTLAQKINVFQTHSVANLVFIIGGAYGVDEALRQRADFLWSLSKLVLPHQLVRLVLIEQLYRATEINRGSGYHHA